MNIKSAALYGVLFWVLVFIDISIIMFTPLNAYLSILEVVTVPILGAVCACFYFKKEKPSIKEGLKLSAVFIVVSTILDLGITIPFFVGSYVAFYRWEVFASTVLLVLAVMAVAHFKEKGKI